MHKCPHCGVEGLPGLAVRWSYREAPVRCGNCGKLSHVLGSSSNGILGVGMVLACLSVVAAMVLESYAVGAAGLLLVVAHNIWAWRRVELFPISEESAKVAARVSWWLLAVGALLKLFSS